MDYSPTLSLPSDNNSPADITAESSPWGNTEDIIAVPPPGWGAASGVGILFDIEESTGNGSLPFVKRIDNDGAVGNASVNVNVTAGLQVRITPSRVVGDQEIGELGFASAVADALVRLGSQYGADGALVGDGGKGWKYTYHFPSTAATVSSSTAGGGLERGVGLFLKGVGGKGLQWADAVRVVGALLEMTVQVVGYRGVRFEVLRGGVVVGGGTVMKGVVERKGGEEILLAGAQQGWHFRQHS